MFQSFVNRAQRSVDTLVAKYVTRVAVAVPFIVALGFGTAAASAKLSADYGSVTANAILGAAFAALGLAAAAVIGLSGPAPPGETVQEAAETQADAAVDSNAAITPDLLLTALATVGPAALPAIVRLAARNLPVVLAVIVLAYILFSQRSTPAAAEDAQS